MGKKILIVDDEPDILLILRKILEKEGYKVIDAESGEEGLKKIKEVKPDLALVDIMMPGMDGWEVCRRIKENEDTKDITVAMLTVKTEDPDKVKSFDEALADWHIAKPIKRERLIKTVKWLLESPLERGK